MGNYRLIVRKERLGFAAAHFTIFPGGKAERLHGHNYRMSVAVEGKELRGGLLLDFTAIKAAASYVCETLDERTLLPMEHPELQVAENGPSVEVRYRERRYRFPREDLGLLPVANTTVEELARYTAERLVERLGETLREAGVRRLRVGIEETPGQEGAYEACLEPVSS